MTPSTDTRGGLEAAVFVFAFPRAADALMQASLVQAIPALEAYSFDTVVLVKVIILALAYFGLGLWMQRRYQLGMMLAALSFAVGVAADFVIRALRDGPEGAVRSENLLFVFGSGFVIWAVLMLGVVVGKGRTPRLQP